MTFEEACNSLAAAASEYGRGVIDRYEWFERVDAIICAAYPDAKRTIRAPLDATGLARSSPSTSTRQPTRSGVIA